MTGKEVVTQDAATLEALDKAKVLDELYDNETTRPLLLKGIKTIRPTARVPEIDTPEQVLSALKPHLEEIGKTKAELQKERDEFRAEQAREKAKKELDLSDEDFVEVSKLATEKKIGDLSTAAEHWRLTKDVAEPRSGPETTLHLPNFKGLAESPVQWARDEARKVLHEFDVQKRRR